jgi:hypothetical protein
MPTWNPLDLRSPQNARAASQTEKCERDTQKHEVSWMGMAKAGERCAYGKRSVTLAWEADFNG